jgi:hypothetical protein
MALSLDYQIVPLTEDPSQNVTVTLNQQPCLLRVYTKSINVPIDDPQIYTDPPTYVNQNPVFLDLFVNDALVIGGVLCLNDVRIVRDAYLGFVGDLSIIDTSGAGEDPFGVPARLPPLDLLNEYQRTLARTGHDNTALYGKAPPLLAGRIPGLGTRFLLTYWPNLP